MHLVWEEAIFGFFFYGAAGNTRKSVQSQIADSIIILIGGGYLWQM